MNEQGFGYQDVTQKPNANWRMASAPPGRQMLIDGSLVLTYTTVDPESAYLTASDGAAWLYENPDTGDRYAVTFTRVGGFKRVQLT